MAPPPMSRRSQPRPACAPMVCAGAVCARCYAAHGQAGMWPHTVAPGVAGTGDESHDDVVGGAHVRVVSVVCGDSLARLGSCAQPNTRHALQWLLRSARLTRLHVWGVVDARARSMRTHALRHAWRRHDRVCRGSYERCRRAGAWPFCLRTRVGAAIRCVCVAGRRRCPHSQRTNPAQYRVADTLPQLRCHWLRPAAVRG